MFTKPFTATLPITMVFDVTVTPFALSRAAIMVPFFEGGVRLLPELPATTLPFTTHEIVLLVAELQVAGLSVIAPPTLVRVMTGGVIAVIATAFAGVIRNRVEMAKSDDVVMPTNDLRISS